MSKVQEQQAEKAKRILAHAQRLDKAGERIKVSAFGRLFKTSPARVRAILERENLDHVLQPPGTPLSSL